MQTTNGTNYETWRAHYGYQDTEQACMDYQRYLENLALVASLIQEVRS